jgi:DNA-binding transcriptional LysR family regulator
LKVTAPTSFSRFHLAPYLPEFLQTYPEIQLDLHLTDNFVDIIRDGFDLAIRIGELQDSSLVARKLSPDTRVIVAAPSYLEKHGTPKSLKDLEDHNCLSAGAQELWALEGPGGPQEVRVKGNIRSNSADLIREALIGGLGLGLRGTWEIGPELRAGKLKVVLPQYRGSTKMAIYAVYPSRDFMPAKVDVFLDFLGQHFGPDPYWEKDIGLGSRPAAAKTAPRPARAGGKRAGETA